MAKSKISRSYIVNSRLNYVPTIIDEDTNEVKLGIRDKLAINQLKEADIDATYYIIPDKFQYRPDLIAFEQYNNNRYWWVIFEYNELDHPLKDFYTGRQIMIPPLEDVTAFLGVE